MEILMTELTMGVAFAAAFSFVLLGFFTAVAKRQWRWFFAGLTGTVGFTVPALWMLVIRELPAPENNEFALFFAIWGMVLVFCTSVQLAFVWERRNNNDPVFFTAVVASTAAMACMWYAVWLQIDYPLWRYLCVMSGVGCVGMIFLLVATLFIPTKHSAK